jgi:hypothetical protein
MITLRAPASRCCAAPARVRSRPVDSITTSTPSSLHGSASGSVWASGDAVDHDVSVLDGDFTRESPVDRVVFQQVCEGRGVDQVVHRHHLDVGVVFVRGA